MNRRSLLSACPLIVIFGLALFAGFARADSKDSDKKSELKPAGVVGGLMTDFKNDHMVVQLDDQDEPINFFYASGITQPGLANQHIFPVDRINLKYKTEGDKKIVVAVEKVPGRANGVIIGKVLKVYGNFWVAVQPKEGMIEGFALNQSPDKPTAVSDTLKSLNPGDLVAIKYATDFERHRILQLEVKPAPAK